MRSRKKRDLRMLFFVLLFCAIVFFLDNNVVYDERENQSFSLSYEAIYGLDQIHIRALLNADGLMTFQDIEYQDSENEERIKKTEVYQLSKKEMADFIKLVIQENHAFWIPNTLKYNAFDLGYQNIMVAYRGKKHFLGGYGADLASKRFKNIEGKIMWYWKLAK